MTDFEARTGRLRSRLAAGTAAVASDPANVRWLTGLAGEPHQLYGMAPVLAIVGPHGGVRIVAPASELAWIDDLRGLDGVISHGSFVLGGRPRPALGAGAGAGRGFGDAISQALRELDATGAAIFDDGGRPSAFDELRRHLHRRSLRIDPEPWLHARAVKDADEVAALRRVNAVAEAAISVALARATVGTRELDLLRWVREEMVDHGARPLLGSIGIGERGALVDFAPGTRSLGRGEAIRLDVGCVLDGYHADLARTAVLDEPPEWLIAAHDALLAGQEAALVATRAGATGAGVFAAAIAATRAAGLRDYERLHCGHGIGLDMYEPPLIRPDSTEMIRAGMTCCIETPLYLIGRAGVQIEDAVVVTNDGCERLGALPRALLVAGDEVDAVTR